MSSIPDARESLPNPSPLSSWDALDACQQICELLDRYFNGWSGVRYSFQLDQQYRRLWDRMTQPAGTLPGFPSHSAFLDTLPPTLASFANPREEWWLVAGKPAMIYLQGAMLTALEASGIPQPGETEPPARPSKWSIGRPVGSIDRDRAWYLEKAGAYYREHRKVPTQEKFLEYCGVKRSTMRRNFQTCGLWPWENFRQQAFPSAPE